MGLTKVQRYKLPQQPDPTQPQEVATKAYVDSAGGSAKWGPYGDTPIDSVSAAAVQGVPAWGRLAYTNTPVIGIPVKSTDGAKTLKLIVHTSLNTTTIGSTATLFIDGSPTALTFTFPVGGGVGNTSGTASVNITEGQLLSMIIDRTGDGGSLTPASWIVFEE